MIASQELEPLWFALDEHVQDALSITVVTAADATTARHH